jgi:hypothetical protein
MSSSAEPGVYALPTCSLLSAPHAYGHLAAHELGVLPTSLFASLEFRCPPLSSSCFYSLLAATTRSASRSRSLSLDLASSLSISRTVAASSAVRPRAPPPPFLPPPLFPLHPFIHLRSTAHCAHIYTPLQTVLVAAIVAASVGGVSKYSVSVLSFFFSISVCASVLFSSRVSS